MLKLLKIIATGLLCFHFAGAQEPPVAPPMGEPQMRGEGRLLIFKIVPGDKTAKLFVVGKKVGELDLKKDHKLVYINATRNGKTEPLFFKQNGEAYEILNLPHSSEPYDLSIQSEVKGHPETIKIKMPAMPSRP